MKRYIDATNGRFSLQVSVFCPVGINSYFTEKLYRVSILYFYHFECVK